ncbi:unnamed protein product [Closterium sp. NIES-53]
MEGQDENYATTSDIASLRTDMEQTQATLRRLEAFLTSQPGFATAAAATTATAAPTTPAAVATPTFHGPMAPLSPNLEAARPRLPEAFDPSAKGSDVWRFVATLEIYFEAIGCSTPQHDAARIRLAATLLRGPALKWIYYTDVARGEKSWQQFRADLIERFEPINMTYMARQQIHRHKQYSSVAQYTQQMELLFNRITDLTEGEKIQAYTEGLKMEIRRQVIAANYNSYKDIVRAAERYDALTRGQPKTRRFTPNPTAEATARLFFDRIITIHGIPATLISDRDPKFTSKFWKELMGLLGTKLAMSSAYHPQTDGQTERLNQVVEQLLRTACKDNVSHWDTQLPTLEFAYNNASHAATGKTPFFLCYGREPLTPQQPTPPAHVQVAHDFVTTMQQLWEKTQRRLTTMQTSQKQYAHRQRRDHSVAFGDQVLLDTRNLNLSHLPSKLRPRFCGPFLVEAQVTPVTFRLRLPDTWKLHNAFHVQLLKPYKDPNQQFQGRQLPPPPPVLIQDEPEYEWSAFSLIGAAVARPSSSCYAGRDTTPLRTVGLQKLIWATHAVLSRTILSRLFKIKCDADGKIERYKSRLVAKGYQQKEKVDYKELFAPVVKPTTLRTLLAGATIKGWVVKQMDVTTAFLNGILEEEIFMAQPEGFDDDDILIFSPSSDLVKEVMLKLQDKFKCKALGDVSFYLGLHIERDVEKRCMRVHQRKYLEALAANFGQSEGHVATPFPSGFKCVKGPEEESVGEEERRHFHSLVGSLMYAAVNTRLDVAFATGQLARVVQCPNEEQVAAGMRVAKYLGQATVGLQYSAAAQRRQKGADGVEPGRADSSGRMHNGASRANRLRAPTSMCTAVFYGATLDSHSAAALAHRRPAVLADRLSAVLAWLLYATLAGGRPCCAEFGKATITPRSSCQPRSLAHHRGRVTLHKIYAGAMAAQELRWLTYLLTDLGEAPRSPPVLYVDNKAMLALC